MNEKRKRGQGRIFGRPNNDPGSVYWIQFYNRSGAQVRQSTGIEVPADDRAREKALKKVEAQLKTELAKVTVGIAHDSRSLRYEDLRDAFLANYETNEKKSLRRDKEGALYLESVRRMDDFFAGERAVEITTDLIRKFQTHLKTKEGLSNSSVNKSVASLRRMFTLAQREEKISNLPFFPMLPEAKPRKDVLPHDKYPALVNALPSYLRLPVIIGFNTGMREGEILGLKWSNIDWLEQIIRIEDSKNDDPRELPFSGELETALREAYTKRHAGCDFVCYRIDRRGHAQQIGDFRKPWHRCCVKLGLGVMVPVVNGEGQAQNAARPDRPKSQPKPKMKYNGLVFHGLRRTFITDAERAGLPRHEAMKLSGHKTEAVYKRYAIENRTQRRAAIAQLLEYRASKVGAISGTISTPPKQEVEITQ